jgi:acyl-CoA synthetase (NDP forming)
MSVQITDMDVFFNPKSIAIIGASESFKFGYTMTNYLLNSKFKTYPVNINKDIIFGHKVFKNINDIPENIELAIIVVNNEHVLQIVKDSVKKGVKGIIIETAGFAETGIEKFVKIQEEIEVIAKNSNVRIIGPNCVGVTNFNNKFTTAEIDFDQSIENGTISVIAQSGVLGNIFVEWSASQKIGFSKTITLGNKVDVDEIDMLEYLEKDVSTNVITIYLEGVKRGPKLVEILRKLTKPVLILKNGRSELGAKAIKSHTGSIAGDDKIFDSIFKQYSGIYRVNNFYEMFNIAQVFATQPLPKGKNIAIITSSGSLGILACDEIERLGLKLADLNNSTIQEMKSISPNWTSLKNPVDLGPSIFTTFNQSLKAILNDENVDALLHIFAVPQKPIEAFSLPITPHLREMRNLSTKLKKPVITCVFGSRWVVEYFLKHSYKYKIPIMAQISHAIKALKFMYDFGQSNKNISKNIEV